MFLWTFHIKNLTIILLPIIVPINTAIPNIQPDKDKLDILLKRPPILQPKDILEPYPMSNPPIAASINWFLDLIFLILNWDAIRDEKRAPIMTPKFLIERGSFKKPPFNISCPPSISK